MTEERIVIGSLFDVDGRGQYFCSLYAPGERAVDTVLSEGALYATGSGDTADDAVWSAREKLWKGL